MFFGDPRRAAGAGNAPLATPRRAAHLPRVSDRLDELRRQRALAQQQLEWLDAEIAAETARRATAAGAKERPAGRSQPPSPIESISLTSDPAPDDADALIKHFGGDVRSAEEQTKRGCWSAFFLALAITAVAVTAWYLLAVR